MPTTTIESGINMTTTATGSGSYFIPAIAPMPLTVFILFPRFIRYTMRLLPSLSAMGKSPPAVLRKFSHTPSNGTQIGRKHFDSASLSFTGPVSFDLLRDTTRLLDDTPFSCFASMASSLLQAAFIYAREMTVRRARVTFRRFRHGHFDMAHSLPSRAARASRFPAPFISAASAAVCISCQAISMGRVA